MVQVSFLPIVDPSLPQLIMRSVFRLLGFGRQRASVESPYHNADDPTTRTTTVTGAKTRKHKQIPVVQPPSKNAINLSPNTKAALIAFQCTLDALGTTPIPGIGAVTAVLLQVIESVQVGACLIGVSYLHNDSEIFSALRKYLKSRQVGKS